jgi:hypothetical protein
MYISNNSRWLGLIMFFLLPQSLDLTTYLVGIIELKIAAPIVNPIKLKIVTKGITKKKERILLDGMKYTIRNSCNRPAIIPIKIPNDAIHI